MKDKIPCFVDSEIFQIESREFKGFENGKKYIPLNIYELSMPKSRAIDLNGHIIIETEIKLSDLNEGNNENNN